MYDKNRLLEQIKYGHGSVRSFSYVLLEFTNGEIEKFELKNIEALEEIALIADELIIKALNYKKTNKDTSILTNYNIDDFVEILVSIKHLKNFRILKEIKKDKEKYFNEKERQKRQEEEKKFKEKVKNELSLIDFFKIKRSREEFYI